MISLRTLCKERPGTYILSYREVADMIRKHSADPAEDVAEKGGRTLCFDLAFVPPLKID